VGALFLSGIADGILYNVPTPRPTIPSITRTPREPTPTTGPTPTAEPTRDLSNQEKYLTVKVDPVLPLAAASHALDPAYLGSLRTLATGMMSAMAEKSPGRNLLLSPVSLSMCLSMLLPGASGETQAEMVRALGYGEMDLAGIVAQNRLAFENLYRREAALEVRLANSVWCLKDYPFTQAFLDTASQDFFATIRAIDWSGDADPLALINRWSSENTAGRIPKILDVLDPNAVMVLMNALYFKGEWQLPFGSESTKPQPFTRKDGTVVQAETMGVADSFRIREKADTTSVAMTYKSGMAMVLTVPKTGGASGAMPQDLLEELAGWKEWPSRHIALQVPKFGFSTTIDLPEFLKGLGMRKAFADADFSGLSPRALEDGLCISAALQKTFVAVSEKGTEAAAVTAVVLNGGGPPPLVAFDRPFWFTILDDQGVPLFVGTVQDPTAAE
jgi:serpin B